MSLLARATSALPSLDKARALLRQTRDTGEIRKIRTIAQVVASVERGKEIATEAAEIILLADTRLGELRREVVAAPNASTRPGPGRGKKTSPSEREQFSKDAFDREAHLSKNAGRAIERLAEMAGNGALDKYVAACRKGGVAPSAKAALALGQFGDGELGQALRRVAAGLSVPEAVRETKRDAIKARLEDVGAQTAKASAGVYDVIVLDPPWAIEKIERDVRPNQSELDYPTMTEPELAALHVPCADDCHVWVWTTQKFLPMAFRLLDAWALKYVCTFVWHKPGGFQPINLPQYNCEFALYARRGAPTFLDTKALPTCFNAPRGKHSEKPEAFYEVVRRVTAGRRLDMFNRRAIDGFDGWGKEAADAAE